MNRMRSGIFAAYFLCACVQSSCLVGGNIKMLSVVRTVPKLLGRASVLLRQAAENPEVVKDVAASVVKDVGTSVSKSSWSIGIGTVVGSGIAAISGCGAMFGAFSYFSTLGHNVSDLKGELADMKSASKEMNARMESVSKEMNARFDAYNARSDARFEKVYLGTMSITLGVPALLLIGLGVLQKK
uniref:Uncharacterized protein n=1 Tax=Cryptomonas curvata TaxID=233186 RepID=A0A7S0QWP6_9CRYP|mmetsp:Transcript_55538/g.116228  ORF Transcript_55538/g.116228 Transcript_55538/m.116228 type:complete len:185 (+) Transcript_55538:97-651(+)